MKKKVFICPLGKSDPVSKQFDGPALHITRHYQPDYIYFFVTNQILEKENETNQIRLHFEHLFEQLDFKSHMEFIHLNVDDVSNYDSFFNMPQHFDRILQQHPDSQILVNITSGSTQMNLSLCITALLSNKQVSYVQVKDPNPREKREELNEIPPTENFDYFDESKNRCHEPKLWQLKSLDIVTKVRELIENYRYQEALDLVQSVDDNRRFKELIEIGLYFMNQEFIKVEQLARANHIPYFRHSDVKINTIVHATELLRIHLERKDYASFARFLTPIIFETGILVLIKECGISTTKLNQDSMREVFKKLGIRNSKNQWFIEENGKSVYLSFRHIVDILSNKQIIMDRSKLELIKRLREIEEKVRNAAAHTLLRIDDNFIRNQTNESYSTKQIYQDIQNFVLDAINAWSTVQITAEIFSFLKQLNFLIIEEFNEKIKGN